MSGRTKHTKTSFGSMNSYHNRSQQGSTTHSKGFEDSPVYFDGLRIPAAIETPRFGKITFICAEPGMGKTYLVSRYARVAIDSNRQVLELSYDDASDSTVARRLVRRCREFRTRLQPEANPLLVIDGITPADEFEAASEARAIKRVINEGAQVIVCVRPEAEQLAEEFGDAIRIGTDALLFRSEEDSEAMDLTGGIPALVMAHRGDVNMGTARESYGPRYIETLKVLIDKMLRASLPHEEFRIRLAMILLGEAKIDDIALVAGRCDSEQLFWLERDAPLFGIDARKGLCCCHGLRHDDVLEECLGVLQAIASAEPDLVVRACGVLASRGDAKRSALVCRLCATEHDFAMVCVTWGVSYVGIGEADIVEEGLRVIGGHDGPKSTRELLSAAAAASVLDSAKEVDEAWSALGSLRLSTTVEERLYQTVQLYGACRDVLRSPRHASRYLSLDPRDEVGLACLDHLRAVGLLRAGKFDEAYATISNEMLAMEPSSLPDAFLCDDLMVALMLRGGMADAKERYLMERAQQMYEHSGLRRLRAYHEALVAAMDVLMSHGVETVALVEAATRAERAGDVFFQAVCLTVVAVADVRTHALSRAHVRAAKATSLAEALGEGYLASCAALVDALALELLGEPGAMVGFCKDETRPGELMMIGRLVAQAVGELSDSVQPVDVPMGTPCPCNALWVLNLLASGCKDIWEAIVGVIPPTWVELLRLVVYRRDSVGDVPHDELEARLEDDKQADESDWTHESERTDEASGQRHSERIRVTILGGFGVECDGGRMPENAFARRRSRDLLTLLALAPGHRVRRYAAIEALWPRDDYYKGPRKLYEATGEARKLLSEACRGIGNPVISYRTQGTIGFDPSLVSCDIDDFEREARMTLSEDGDDFWVLEHAHRMQRIYGTGPIGQSARLGALAEQRVSELRSLYVDGTVAAGEAALRVGKTKLAVRYATDAHQMDDLREDAMILLVRALKASGRGFEVANLYRSYSQHLIEVQGVPPSLTLRRAVEQALGNGPDLYTT